MTSAEDSGLPDYSLYPFPFELWYILPEWEVIIKISAFIPIIILGVFGNVLLLTIIVKHRPLHTPTNLIIANMATADLATLIISPAMFLIHDFYQNYELGGMGCNLEGFLEGALLITAVLNLCAVSYDRLTAIVLPMETRLTLHGAKIVMASTWIMGFLFAIPLAVYRTYKERKWLNFLEKYCSENQVILPVYWHVLISALVWFPLGVMLICYSAIFYKLEKYEKEVLKREHPISISYKTKVARTLFIVVITFIVLRLPFTAVVFFRTELLKKSQMNQIAGSFQILWFTAHYLIFLNAAVNPLIYGFTNDNFRRAFYQIKMFRFCCKSDGNFQTSTKLQASSNKRKHQLKQSPQKHQIGDTNTENKQSERNIISGFWFRFTNEKQTSASLVNTNNNIVVQGLSLSSNIDTKSTKMTNQLNSNNHINDSNITMIYDGTNENAYQGIDNKNFVN